MGLIASITRGYPIASADNFIAGECVPSQFLFKTIGFAQRAPLKSCRKLKGARTMSEVMTVESIIEANWIVNGYWTKTRVPYDSTRDIDILAYSVKHQHLVIAESKAQGPAGAIYAYTQAQRDDHNGFCRYIQKDGSNYIDILAHIPNILREDALQCLFWPMKRLTVQLVFNVVTESEELRKSAEEEMANVVKTAMIGTDFQSIEVDCKLQSHLEVLSETMTKIGGKGGRRYGHTVLDLASELNRYLNPCRILDAGSNKKLREIIVARAASTFRRAIGEETLK